LPCYANTLAARSIVSYICHSSLYITLNFLWFVPQFVSQIATNFVLVPFVADLQFICTTLVLLSVRLVSVKFQF